MKLRSPLLPAILALLLPLASPAEPSADALRAEADALTADIATRLGSSVRPGTPFPGVRPPVAPEADPIAAIDPAALANDQTEFNRMSGRLSKESSRHPLTPDDAAVFADVLPRLTNLAASADAFATPGYRSSLPGLVSPPDGPSSPDTYWIEPRLTDAILAASFLAHRIRLALAQGAPDSAVADRARLRTITEILLREPSSLGPASASTFRNPAAFPGLPPDALADAARDASALADDLEARWPDLLLADFHCIFSDSLSDVTPAPDGTPADVWVQTLRLAALRHLDASTDAIRDAFALPPGSDRAAALPPLPFDPALPLPEHLAKVIVNVAWHATFLAVARSRDNASIALAADALLRYHRYTGTLPDTLEALVPDYLPFLPLAYATGTPLSFTPVTTPLPGFTLTFPDPDASSPPFFPLP